MSGYVFVSYAREDSEYVGKLVNFLRGEGIEVWYDANLVPGRRFDEAVEEKIAQCAAFVVVTTPAAHASDWVHDELDCAKENEREVLAILLDETRKIMGTGRVHCEQLKRGENPGSLFVTRLRGLVGEGELLFEMKAHDGHVLSVAYPSRSSSMVASAGKDCVRIWHPTTGQLRREIPGATWPVSFSKYGDTIATGGPGHAAHLWDTETGELIKTVGQHKKPLTSIAVAPNGPVLVTGSGDTMEQVWDLETGDLVRTLTGRVKPASPLVFSPDGDWLVAPTEAGNRLGAGMWDVRTGQRICSLKGHRGSVHDVTVSWDGRYVATGGDDHTARIWDAKTGDEMYLLAAHTGPVRAVAFSPNGYRLATGSTDQTIRLWDATTGGYIMCVTKRAAGIYDLAYSPDGRTLASGHGDGAIRIWSA